MSCPLYEFTPPRKPGPRVFLSIVIQIFRLQPCRKLFRVRAAVQRLFVFAEHVAPFVLLRNCAGKASTGTCAAWASDRRAPFRPFRASGNMFDRTVVRVVRASAL